MIVWDPKKVIDIGEVVDLWMWSVREVIHAYISTHVVVVLVSGRGNVTMAAEFNFYADPEAAYVVLNNLRAPITMACWELCLKHSLPWVSHTYTPPSSTLHPHTLFCS